jgi:hypothetical protein
MTIEKVDRYQTGDGVLHQTLGDAKKYVVDSVSQVLDARLRPILLGSEIPMVSANELFRVIIALTGDYDSVTELMDELNGAYDEVDI